MADNVFDGTPDMLGEYPIYLTLSDGQDTVVQDIFNLDVVNFKPEIVAVDDIPNDQGGRVYINFTVLLWIMVLKQVNPIVCLDLI